MILAILFMLFLIGTVLFISFKIFGWIFLKMIAIGVLGLFVVVGILALLLGLIII